MLGQDPSLSSTKCLGILAGCLADWKPASVIPTYKKGMKKYPETHRPVGLTSVPGKIMDKVIWMH